jgi:hypothetical protein
MPRQAQGFAGLLAPSTPAAALTGGAPALAPGMLAGLMSLQSVTGPAGPRERAVARATRLLDGLDALKVALLEGRVSPETLTALRDGLRAARDKTGDPQLEDVLDSVDLRAEVELAKWEAARRS